MRVFFMKFWVLLSQKDVTSEFFCYFKCFWRIFYNVIYFAINFLSCWLNYRKASLQWSRILEISERIFYNEIELRINIYKSRYDHLTNVLCEDDLFLLCRERVFVDSYYIGNMVLFLPVTFLSQFFLSSRY